MKTLLLFFLLGLTFTVSAQRHSLEGVWQGIIMSDLEQPKDGKAFWMEFNMSADGKIEGSSREEKPYTEMYAYKRMGGKVINDSIIQFEDVNIRKEINSSHLIWCLNKGELTYNSQTGYLEGKFRSTDCKRQSGKIILFRSKYEISRTDTNNLYHSWFDNFVGDLKRGWPAYYVRDAEMRNFEMKPVLFDHDKDSIKPEFHAYLDQMVKIVLSHSDLRIKIIGHTDSNGTDDYNIDLSQRRANNVKQYLISKGLKPDRVVIEYRGERDPFTSNETVFGKSLNRRVDFEFI
ncbi:MAG: OmpA family protein [Crocinitomicaceae bacterium]|nr:OmpA family protein [Crocinitomicaceae bacterium]